MASLVEPFGIPLGAPIASLGEVEAIGEGVFRVFDPAKRHPRLQDYFVRHHKSTGVAWVKGCTNVENCDPFGTSLRTPINDLAGQISTKYGPGRFIDTFYPDGTWPDPQDWMMAMSLGERTYGHLWGGPPSFQGPRSPQMTGIHSIFCCASAMSSYEGMFSVEYELDNFPAFQSALKRDLSDHF